MPLYAYRCRGCGGRNDVFKVLAQLNRAEYCLLCQDLMDRQVAAPAIVKDYAPYNCPVTGKLIEGRAAHVENLKQQGCRVYEPGETRQLEQLKARQESDLDAAVERTAEEFVHNLPVQKREKLTEELFNQGLITTVERT